MLILFIVFVVCVLFVDTFPVLKETFPVVLLAVLVAVLLAVFVAVLPAVFVGLIDNALTFPKVNANTAKSN